MSSTIGLELEKAAGLKKAKTESRPHYLERVVRAVADVSEESWNALSPEAKKWYDQNVDRLDKKEEPLDFPEDGEKESAVKKNAVADEPEAPAPSSRSRNAKPKAAKAPAAPASVAAATPPAAPKAAPKKAAKPKVAAKKAAKPKAAAPKAAPKAAAPKKAKGVPASDAIRKLIFKKPNISEQDIFEALKKDYPTLSIGTIGTTRAGFRAAMRITPEYREKFS